MVFSLDFVSYEKSVPEILGRAGLASLIKDQTKIILKPNLTINRPAPCTTPAEFVEQVIKFCQKYSNAEIFIAEGAGGCDTRICFQELGYNNLAEKYGVKLTDLNREARIEKQSFFLPAIVFTGFFINLPVLKEHHEWILSCAMKNNFGLYLSKEAVTNPFFDFWSKRDLHQGGAHKAIWDLNLCRPADFVLVDASVGQRGHVLSGEPCDPPLKKLFAGIDNLEVDREAAPYLGLNPTTIPYLNFS